MDDNVLEDQIAHDSKLIMEHYHDLNMNIIHLPSLLNFGSSEITINPQPNDIHTLFFTESEKLRNMKLQLAYLKLMNNSPTNNEYNTTKQREILNNTINDNQENYNIQEFFDNLLCERIIDVKNILTNENANLSDRDSSVKQVMKDIQRDKLLINNNLILGSTNDFQSILERIKDIIDKLIKSHYHLNINIRNMEIFIIKCLQMASRTNSGSIAFQILQKLSNLEEYSIVPQSTSAPPLVLQFFIEPEIDNNLIDTTIKCFMKCTTIFRLIEMNTTKEITLKIAYENVISYNDIGNKSEKTVDFHKNCKIIINHNN